jgi:hypothetical protein
MTMNRSPEASPISWMVTMLGWFSEEAARASWAKRPIRSGTAAKGGQELHGDVAAEVVVPGAVDLAHAPGAQLVEELVPAEPHADRRGHGAPGSDFEVSHGQPKMIRFEIRPRA